MEKTLTCIVCPLGCALSVRLEGKNVLSVTGNTCPRGKEYAETECTNPQRTVTTTMLCSDGSLVSVKTEMPIPKEQMTACMAMINASVANLPIAVGDVLLENVCGSRIVATQNRGIL